LVRKTKDKIGAMLVSICRSSWIDRGIFREGVGQKGIGSVGFL